MHPLHRTSGLGLTNERVVLMSASNIRCSVVTESGKVATWMDESLAHVCGKLEQSATAYPDLFGTFYIFEKPLRDFMIENS